MNQSKNKTDARPIDYRVLLPLIDLTALNQTDSMQSNSTFIAKANQGFNGCLPAAVCLFPKYASLLKENLRPEIKSCVVSSYFPSAQTTLALKVQEIKYLNGLGLDEIDVVMPIGEFLEGNDAVVLDELRHMRSHTNATLKVILETGALESVAQVKRAGMLAIQSGADFLKTSTGKFKVGATLVAARALAEVIADEYQRSGKMVGLKFAGGIRTMAEAAEYVAVVQDVLGDQWLDPQYFRIGASSLYDNIISTC